MSLTEEDMDRIRNLVKSLIETEVKKIYIILGEMDDDMTVLESHIEDLERQV